MPTVARPDGVEIHWESRGEGPLVLIAHPIWSDPDSYVGLVDDLSRDHQVLVYDPRGFGQSTARGPYDLDTDAGDLAAVADEAGGDAVAIAPGNAFNYAVRVAAARPDLVARLLVIGPAAAVVLPRAELKGSGVIAGSDSVADMLLQMMATDPRAAMHAWLAAVNPQLDEREMSERVDRLVAYSNAPDAGIVRAKAWMEDDPTRHSRSLDDRLWILHTTPEELFEGALADRVTEVLPNAHLEEISSGPLARPDITAAAVRRLTVGRSEARSG